MAIDGRDPAHAQPFQQQRDGFILAATLVDDVATAREFFFHPLPEQGLIPVVLHLENEGAETLVLERESIRLLLENGETLAPARAREIIDEGQLSYASAYLGLPLIFPFVMQSRGISDFNYDLAADYRDKALPPYLRVTPSDPPSARVLFFRLPREQQEALTRSPVLEVKVDVEARGSGGGVRAGRSVPFRLALGRPH